MLGAKSQMFKCSTPISAAVGTPGHRSRGRAMFSPLSCTRPSIPGLRQYGQDKLGLVETSSPKACTRTRQPRASSGQERNLNSPAQVTDYARRPQRCRLQDLCAEDRAKLARLVMELAAAQEALANQPTLANPDSSHSVGQRPTDGIHWIEDNQEPRTPTDQGKSIAGSVDTKSVKEAKKQIPEDSLNGYNTQLTQLEQELQRLRVMMADCHSKLSPVSQSEHRIVATESKALHQPNPDPADFSKSDLTTKRNTFEQDRISAPTQSPSIITQSQSFRKTENKKASVQKQELRQKLLRDRELLHRQRQVLHVVAKQQVQLERLDTEVQYMGQLLTQTIRDSTPTSARVATTRHSNPIRKVHVTKHTTSLPVWQPLNVQVPSDTPNQQDKLAHSGPGRAEVHESSQYLEQNQTSPRDPIQLTPSYTEQPHSEGEDELVRVKPRALNNLKASKSSCSMVTKISTVQNTPSDLARLPDGPCLTTPKRSGQSDALSAQSRRATHRYWTESGPSRWVRGEPCGQSDRQVELETTYPLPDCYTQNIEQCESTMNRSPPLMDSARDAQTSTPSTPRSHHDQAVQCHVSSTSPAAPGDTSGVHQPASSTVNQAPLIDSAVDEVGHVLNLISDLDQPFPSFSSSSLNSLAAGQHSTLATTRSVQLNQWIGIETTQTDSRSWLRSTTPIMSAMEQELFEDLFFRAQ